jgi:hypothetical protein
VLMSPRHKEALGPRFDALNRKGKVEVLQPWTNPRTDRATVISDAALRQIIQDSLPIEIRGDPVEYQINRTETGWVVELINNLGVIKRPDEAAVTDPKAIAHVQLKLPPRCASATAWRSGRTFEKTPSLQLTVGPGSSEFVEFLCGN